MDRGIFSSDVFQVSIVMTLRAMLAGIARETEKEIGEKKKKIASAGKLTRSSSSRQLRLSGDNEAPKYVFGLGSQR